VLTATHNPLIAVDLGQVPVGPGGVRSAWASLARATLVELVLLDQLDLLEKPLVADETPVLDLLELDGQLERERGGV
jgi:hypothetical protein